MKYLKMLNGWAWAEIIFLLLVIFFDNTSNSTDGLWISLLAAVVIGCRSILDEMHYSNSLPVNHPEQEVTDKGVLANLIRSVLSTVVCLTPLISGPIWVQILAILSLIVCTYSIVAAYRLYSFVKNDVKYEG